MKKHTVLITAVSVLILLAALIAALNAIFTVTKVEISFTVYSEEGKEDAKELQNALEEQYLSKSSAFLDLDDVKETVAQYTSFELVELKKGLPQKLLLTVSEKTELFAYEKEDGTYCILDDAGCYLYDKEKNVNRAGGECILLEGFSLTVQSAGVKTEGDFFDETLSLVTIFSETLENVRANIVSVTLGSHSVEGGYLHVQTREGVSFDIYTPKNNTEEKIKAALETYLALSEAEKLYGYFDLIDTADGTQFTISRHYAE